jgi:hypothetical protein
MGGAKRNTGSFSKRDQVCVLCHLPSLPAAINTETLPWVAPPARPQTCCSGWARRLQESNRSGADFPNAFAPRLETVGRSQNAMSGCAVNKTRVAQPSRPDSEGDTYILIDIDIYILYLSLRARRLRYKW